QLRGALKNQTNFMNVMLSGMTGAMNSDAMRKQQEAAQKAMRPGSIAGMALGVAPAMPQISGEEMQRGMQQAMTDPWVRGIEAARALEKIGDPNAAARFYVHCLGFLPEDWVPEACLQGILALGPDRAATLFEWMLADADSIVAGPMEMAGGMPSLDPKENARKPKKGEPAAGTVQIRNAALAGLGVLVGGHTLSPERSEAALTRLLGYAQGKEKEPYSRGVAAGLGRSLERRAIEPLRRLAKAQQDADTRQAALRALAVGFADEAAKKQLHGELDASDPEDQLRAAQALYEIGDPAAFDWAVEVITARRSTDTKRADIRALVVRDLVELGGEKSRAALSRALSEGPGNDWLIAWTRVALLELGDTSQLPAVEAALTKNDWNLDHRGFRSIWRAIKPFLIAAASLALTAGLAAPTVVQQVRQAVSLVGNFATGERSRYLAKVDARQGVTAQLRWQAASAIAAAHPANAERLLEQLLDDDAPPVRMSAALAIAELGAREAKGGLLRAMRLDYGAEGGIDRSPEIRAALLRAAWIRDSGAAETREMARLAAADTDGAVRFIGLAMLQPR
ncbi:MAG: hypothetical protein ABI639_16315, partial [Thermoanaerobaculia bacterium]